MIRVADRSFGQLFITDARAARCRELLKAIGDKAQFVEVEKGKIKSVDF